MRELDPDLWEWVQMRRRHRMCAVPVLMLGAALLLGVVIMSLSQ